MPIRIETPLARPTAINAPAVSMEAAAAPARALAKVAGAIGQTADQFTALGQNLARIDNARKLSEERQRIAADYAKFQNDLANEIDPEKRLAATESFLSAQESALDQPGLPPDLRDSLTQHFSEFSTRARIGEAENSAKLTTRRAVLAVENEIQQARTPQEFEAAAANLPELGIPPEQVERLRMDFADRTRREIEERTIYDHPADWLENNPEPPADRPIAEYENNRRLAYQLLRQETAETVDFVEDGIASGQITTEEQLGEQIQHLRPAVQETILKSFRDRKDELTRAQLTSPEYQNEILGRAAAALSSYDPAAEGVDLEYVKIDSMLRSLPPSAVRDELNRHLDSLRTGKKAEIKDHKDAAHAALDDHFTQKRKALDGYPGAQMNTGRAINDGFLRDKTKLLSLGYSDQQADEIIGNDEDTDAARKRRFQTLAVSRAGEPTADPFTIATAEAILNGDTVIRSASPEQEDAAIQQRLDLDRQQGATKTKLAEYLKTNPTASNTEIQTKIRELAGEETRKKLSGEFFDPKPETPSAAPKGADPSTSAIPMGKDLIAVVKHFEAGGAKGGFHAEAYWDYGQWSIGFGTKSKKGETITREEAEKRLNTELASHRARVEAETKRLNLTFTPAQMDALTSFDYNTGSIAKLLANGTRTKAEIAEKMLLYRNAGGERLAGLERRRAAERFIFLNGYPSDNS